VRGLAILSNMSARLSTGGAASDAQAWQQLEGVFAGLGQLARSRVAPDEFYRKLLDESVRALSAIGGAVWLRAPNGALRPVVQINWPGSEMAADDDGRRAHETLLTSVATSGQIVSVAPHAAQAASPSGNPTEHVLLVGAVRLARDEEPNEGGWGRGSAEPPAIQATGGSLAIIEILQRPGVSPAAARGCEEFLAAVCELAADFHARHELARLRQDEHYREELLRFAGQVHRHLDLKATAYTVANEGRRVAGCDRLSVVAATGRRCRLLATSGVGRVDRRSGAARRLEHLAELVRRVNEPAYYADGQSDALPPIAEALEQHAEQSHARQVAVVPLGRPTDSADGLDTRSSSRPETPRFVLVAEEFDARRDDMSRHRLAEVGELCATALYHALEVDRLPLQGVLRPLAAGRQFVAEHLSRTAMVVALLAAVVAALVLVPADFNVEAPGTLQPTVRQDVFAPRDGLVDEVLATHGATVTAGQPLVRLRDPSLDLELKRAYGEQETARRQLDAVRTTRTGGSTSDADATDLYRLSADQRELEQRLTNLEREIGLLEHEREKLVVRSPIAGRVLTWDVAHRLVARPVQRGEVLVTVADLSADWHLELDVPDDRIGYVMAAAESSDAPLPVRFRLRSEDDQLHTGHIAEVCRTADVRTDAGAAAEPTVLVRVALDRLELSDAARRELRPGLSARAEIECGRRPVGYVWLHDVWDALVRWVRF
jgi:multidrug efflux pump subunit AcrA (membrane-fusion protein)